MSGASRVSDAQVTARRPCPSPTPPPVAVAAAGPGGSTTDPVDEAGVHAPAAGVARGGPVARRRAAALGGLAALAAAVAWATAGGDSTVASLARGGDVAAPHAPAASLDVGRFDVGSLSSLARAALPFGASAPVDAAPAPGAPAAPAAGEGRAAPPADETIEREGRGRVPGGVVFVPASFHSPDGAYDVLVHFHGNTAVVRESAEVAELNAIVVVINLGVGSAPYEEAYEMPGTYEQLLASIDGAVARRGLDTPRLRRLALSSWSAGYGALSTILKRRRGHEPLDAVLVLDGIHVGWDPETVELDEDGRAPPGAALDARNLAPFIGLAERAAAGDLLFSITHADVKPETYAGASDTASFLLAAAGGERMPRYSDERASVGLRSAVGAVPKKMEKKLELTSEAVVGGLHVRGFSGATPEHHMAHLLEMGQTVLPELAERWRR